MKSPVYHVIAVPLEKVRANAYNPNAVAPPEMKLLEHSIWEDGLSAQNSPEKPQEAAPEPDEAADRIDPDNPEIVTTYAERRVLDIARAITGAGEELVGKDTQSYFTLLWQGKMNRWILRYDANKKAPSVQFRVPLDEHRRREIARAGLEIGVSEAVLLPNPEDLYRVAGIVTDAMAFCRNEDNFKQAKKAPEPHAA